jgi:hypothetical protein
MPPFTGHPYLEYEFRSETRERPFLMGQFAGVAPRYGEPSMTIRVIGSEIPQRLADKFREGLEDLAKRLIDEFGPEVLE